MTRKILVGYQPGPYADDPVALAATLADLIDAEPLVVTALAWPSQIDAPPEAQAEEGMLEAFEGVRRQLAPREVETRAIVSSSAALPLSEQAESEEALAIVLGSSHRGALGRTLAGSVGESLMHGAPCAVAIAPHGHASAEDRSIKKIAVAFDGSAEANAALETAIRLARRCEAAAISVLTVADYPHYGYGFAWTVLNTSEITDSERAEKERLAERAEQRVPSPIPSERRVMTGDAGELLAEASGEFDLLVTGSRAYGPLRRVLLGSTSRKLIRAAACPVLVVPRGSGSDPLLLGG